MKVVTDTNVFVSGIFWKGSPRKVVDLFVEEKITVYASPDILTELFRVLEQCIVVCWSAPLPRITWTTFLLL